MMWTFLTMFSCTVQVKGTDQVSYSGQWLHEESGDVSDPGDSGLYVSSGLWKKTAVLLKKGMWAPSSMSWKVRDGNKKKKARHSSPKWKFCHDLLCNIYVRYCNIFEEFFFWETQKETCCRMSELLCLFEWTLISSH